MPLQVLDGDIPALAFEATSKCVTTSRTCKGKEAAHVHQQPLCSYHTTAVLSGTAGELLRLMSSVPSGLPPHGPLQEKRTCGNAHKLNKHEPCVV